MMLNRAILNLAQKARIELERVSGSTCHVVQEEKNMYARALKIPK
jgi:hypothetical protein